MTAKPLKKPFIAIKPTLAQTSQPLLTINLSDLTKIDEFCSANEAVLDPTYTGTGCNGCISIAIFVPDDKKPGYFLQSLLTHITPILPEPLTHFMSRNVSVITHNGRWLVFPRLTTIF